MESYNLNSFFDKIYVISLVYEPLKREFLSSYLGKYNIEFEFFDAIDGMLDYNLNKLYKQYLKLEINDPRSPKLDKEYRKKSLISVGALGLLESYKKIFENSIKNNYKYIMVMEEDVLLSKDINQSFKKFIYKIPEFDLLFFGASQYIWDYVKIEELDIKKYDGKRYSSETLSFYNANKYTYGSFAVGYNCSILPKIVDSINEISGPIDSGCLREVITDKNKSCYVLFPNKIIADTTLESSISHQKRNLRNHKFNVRWNLKNIDFESNIWKVSILVANFNSRKTITSTLKSVKDQVYKNIELIIVDDNSSDDSCNLIEKFIENNKEIDIKLIKLKSNIGAYGCRNIALKKAKGEFITILDSDDILIKDKILKDVYNYFNKENYELFFSKIYRSNTIKESYFLSGDEAKEIIKEERKAYNHIEENKKPWNYKIRFGIQTIFASTDFFKEYGFWRSDYRYGMDIDLIQRYIYNKYKKFINYKDLWNEIYVGNGEKYGIYLSDSLGLISHKINDFNATIMCKNEKRDNIHKECEKDFLV